MPPVSPLTSISICAIGMPTSTADKLTAVIAQVAAQGNADVLRLTVLKNWFERPGRLQAFALWVACP